MTPTHTPSRCGSTVRFTRSGLRRCGIVVRDEHARPVGDQGVGDEWGDWVCPHVFGGIPPSVVDCEFPMTRTADGKFLAIDGLTDGEATLSKAPPKKAARR